LYKEAKHLLARKISVVDAIQMLAGNNSIIASSQGLVRGT
jgi:hypothetical protein